MDHVVADRQPSAAGARPSLSQSESTNNRNCCPICFNELLDIAAYQSCGHVLCFDCSVRNRVLCDKKECPVCRAESEQVVLAGHRLNRAEDDGDRYRTILATGRHSMDQFYGFVFENIGIERQYRKILTHNCRFCDRKFDLFDDLVKHCRERHEQHYCGICVRSLMLFTWEHKLYSYDELLRHMDEGDPGEKNIHPHPQCQLCHFRAFDKDALFKHSKHVHQLCWICERHHNKLLFFGNFAQLAEHMTDHHFVCKRCTNPAEARLMAFIDANSLEIHTAAEHSDNGAIRPEMLFNFHQKTHDTRRGPRQNHRRDEDDYVENVPAPSPPPPQNFTMNAEQFPTLGHDGANIASSKPGANYKNAAGNATGEVLMNAENKPRYAPPKLSEDHFPSLGGTVEPVKSAPKSSWTNGAKAAAQAPAPNLAKKFTVDRPKTTKQSEVSPAPREEAFPALNGPTGAAAVSTLNTQWQSVKSKSKSKSSPQVAAAVSSSAPTHPPKTGWNTLDTPPESARTAPFNSVAQPPSPRFARPAQKLEPVDSESFPTLAKPSGKALPMAFGGATKSAKTKKEKEAKIVNQIRKTPTAKVHESESAALARVLFSTSSQRDHEEDDEETGQVAPVAPPPMRNLPAKPFSMKKDEFPSLHIAAPRNAVKAAAETMKVDRVQKQKEVKSQWGNTVVQYETVFQYIQPPNAADRRTNLHAKIEPVQLKDKTMSVEDFQRQLLSGELSALEFWMECRRILGKKFGSVMGEVVLLMPNLLKQGEVFEVAKMPIYGEASVVRNLVQCATCGQVVQGGEEKNYHTKFHKN